jgi:hypothetical protein
MEYFPRLASVCLPFPLFITGSSLKQKKQQSISNNFLFFQKTVFRECSRLPTSLDLFKKSPTMIICTYSRGASVQAALLYIYVIAYLQKEAISYSFISVHCFSD